MSADTPAETGEDTPELSLSAEPASETGQEPAPETGQEPAPETGQEPAPDDTPVPAAAPAVAATPATSVVDVRSNRRKVREGLVLSVAMDQTAVVGVIERVRHPRYAKTVQRTKRLYAHAPNNDLRVGDRVRLAETRPMSKLKRWRIVDVLERAK
jgi:small subunit ribosomal protein S17